MKRLILLSFVFVGTMFLSACSYGYDVLIINESSYPIEITYKLNQQYSNEKPMIMSIEEWKKGSVFNPDKIIEYEIKQENGVRVIKLPAKIVLKIDSGNWNPIQEERGELTQITEIKIISHNGEISYKGKLLLNQFEKYKTTYTKTIKDEFTN